jgi:hypothetical protein
MPDFMECLAYVEEYCCKILSVFKSFEYGIGEPMTLVGGVVLFAEPKFM